LDLIDTSWTYDRSAGEEACIGQRRDIMTTMTVRDWMTPNPITVDPQTPINEAYSIMKKNRIRRLPVVDREKLVGIVTIGDIREASPSDATSLSIWEQNYLLSKLTVGNIMTKNPITVTPDTTIRDAAALMLEHKIGGLPVVEGGKVVGIITESDIFRLLVKVMDGLMEALPA
jgi:CBS domain-containing protein